MKTKTHITTVLFVASLLALPCYAKKEPKDPYKNGAAEASPGNQANDADEPEANPEEPVNLSSCYETFSLPLEAAAAVQRRKLGGKELYAWVVAECEAGRAKQETLAILKSKNGQKATSEAISELIAPTEYEPAQAPGAVGVALPAVAGKDDSVKVPDTSKLQNAATPEALASLVTPAIGTAFETRNVGFTLEIETIMGESRKFVELRIIPEHITDVGRVSWGQGVSITEMPIFEKQSLNTSATVGIGQPFLLGTMSRPPVSIADKDSAKRVWFAFITVDIDK